MQSKKDYRLIPADGHKIDQDFIDLAKGIIQEDVNKHIIINLEGVELKKTHAIQLTELFRNGRSSTRSLILVIDEEYLELFSDEDPVVPTLEEAEDFLEMEIIERELGFGEEEEE